MLKKLPLGIQTFEKIIEGDYLYVDKTKEIANLVQGGGTYFFLSRPRRFGKSLLVSTLKSLFQGKQELFKGLWIYDQIEWNTHPVVHLDFSSMSYNSPEQLAQNLSRRLIEHASAYQVELEQTFDYKNQFRELIQKLSSQGQVVLLIDEYDKPIIDFIGEPLALENRQVLKSFYEVIKGCDEYIRFVLLTGVSKFSKVSVFSGLNNLTDMTLSLHSSKLLGYTQQELEYYFQDHFIELASILQTTSTFLIERTKKWYNGYSWDGKNFVYNPYSILSLFTHQQFNNYWFTTGTPTFLLKLIKQQPMAAKNFENYVVGASILESFDLEQLDLITLLFQTGYLTIKTIEPIGIDFREYILSYPNLEVKESLVRNILTSFSEGQLRTETVVNQLVRSLLKQNLESFFSQLKSLFASIPSHIFIKDREAYYHTIIYLILTLMGVHIQAEVHTSTGRIDAVVETEQNIYIFEFKLGTAQEALQQIEEKQYHQPYLHSGKLITLIGVGFDVEQKTIESYLTKGLD